MTALTAQRARELLNYEPRVGGFTWEITRGRFKKGTVAGCRRADGYWLLRLDDRLYLGHRVAWLMMTGAWPNTDIDHRDGNPSNNSWRNLRQATRSQNITNQKVHKDSRSGHKGVRAHKNGRFYVHVGSRYIGAYATLAAAQAAYREAARLIHGEFARI